MLSENERVPRTRSIRRHLLNYQDRRDEGRTLAGARRELEKAVRELVILVRLETGGADIGEADQGREGQEAGAEVGG